MVGTDLFYRVAKLQITRCIEVVCVKEWILMDIKLMDIITKDIKAKKTKLFLKEQEMNL